MWKYGVQFEFIMCCILDAFGVLCSNFNPINWRWPSGLEHWTGDRVVHGSNPAAVTSLRNFGNSVYPALPVYFYLVSMPGEVKDPTSLHWKCVTCRGLHHPLLETHAIMDHTGNKSKTFVCYPVSMTCSKSNHRPNFCASLRCFVQDTKLNRPWATRGVRMYSRATLNPRSRTSWSDWRKWERRWPDRTYWEWEGLRWGKRESGEVREKMARQNLLGVGGSELREEGIWGRYGNLRISGETHPRRSCLLKLACRFWYIPSVRLETHSSDSTSQCRWTVDVRVPTGLDNP